MKDNHRLIYEKYKFLLDKILAPGWDIKLTEDNVSFSEKFNAGSYTVTVPQGTIRVVAAKFQLVPMINCCGVVVSTRAEVSAELRNLGLGTTLNALRIDIARYLGYSVLLCTDVDSNTHQRNILKRNGWRDIFSFLNRRTGNVVHVSVINL